MQRFIRLASVFTGRSFHVTRPLINHQLHTKTNHKMPKIDFPLNTKSENLASQARKFTDEFNGDEVSIELEPLLDFILAPPTSGLKRKEIHVHPTTNKGKFKCSDEEKNYKYFMDLQKEHIKYIRSEGFTVDYVTYNTPYPDTFDKYPYYDTTRYDYPYYRISWYK